VGGSPRFTPPTATRPPVAPPAPPVAPGPSPEALAEKARLEEQLDAASRDRARAEDRAAGAEREFRTIQLASAHAAGSLKRLGTSTRDPRPRLAQAQQRGELLQREVAAIESDLTHLEKMPRPRKRPLLEQSPVAQVVDGQEFHFELRDGRVTFIDLDRLVAKVKADARIQLQMMGRSLSSRPILSTVGPVGAFSIRYELGRAPASSVDSVLRNPGEVTYTLIGWELVPTRSTRGETFEMARQPLSDFARAVNSLDPRSATITLWIYPDSFDLYRRVRDLLHERGYLVAARPLPEAMPIRGSPGGSMSAGQ
jgi:hypothetical protein